MERAKKLVCIVVALTLIAGVAVIYVVNEAREREHIRTMNDLDRELRSVQALLLDRRRDSDNMEEVDTSSPTSELMAKAKELGQLAADYQNTLVYDHTSNEQLQVAVAAFTSIDPWYPDEHKGGMWYLYDIYGLDASNEEAAYLLWFLRGDTEDSYIAYAMGSFSSAGKIQIVNTGSMSIDPEEQNNSPYAAEPDMGAEDGASEDAIISGPPEYYEMLARIEAEKNKTSSETPKETSLTASTPGVVIIPPSNEFG